MGITIGPTDWWVATPAAINSLATSCPPGTILPDRSVIICRAGGTAWIIAPSSTQVCQTWNNSTTTAVGNKCCVCDFPTLCTRMISCGFTPADWFVPAFSQLQNPGVVCRTNWDTFDGQPYWSSTETNTNHARPVCLNGGYEPIGVSPRLKTNTFCVRAFRCVTY